jgi:hypothetical protein
VVHADATVFPLLAPQYAHLDPEVRERYISDYIGEISHGKYNGGAGILKGQGTIYSGEWKYGAQHGNGRSWWNGRKSTYDGQWKNGLKHGHGHFIECSSAAADGKGAGGNGTVIAEYTGGYKRNLMWGKGQLVCATATVTGDWKANVQHGQSEVVWNDGTRFRGNYRYGVRCKYGETTWPDGARYCGQWLNNQRHGDGTMTFPNGISWTGSFVHDTRNGPGVLTWPDGDTFTGTWERGRRLGRGTFSPRRDNDAKEGGGGMEQIWNEPIHTRYSDGAAKWPE